MVVRRWQDPVFPVNFPWFGSSDYWRGQVDMLHEQIGSHGRRAALRLKTPERGDGTAHVISKYLPYGPI